MAKCVIRKQVTRKKGKGARLKIRDMSLISLDVVDRILGKKNQGKPNNEFGAYGYAAAQIGQRTTERPRSKPLKPASAAHGSIPMMLISKESTIRQRGTRIWASALPRKQLL